MSIFKDKRLKQLRFAFLFGIFSIAIGIIGYYSLGNFTFLEAVYMTVITISTVGFTEVHPLNSTGQIFTIFFIICNLILFAYVISVLTKYFFEGELKEIYKSYMTNLDVKKLNNHVIVCGYGRNGSKACEELMKEKIPFVIIDNNPDVVKHKLSNQSNILFYEGDATDDETLISAGIHKAKSIISTLPKDADNVFVTLTARELNPEIKIIARASEQSSERKLFHAGANNVVMPDAIGGLHMAHLITKPDVIQFIDLISGVGNVKLKMDEISFAEMNEEFKNKTIRELDLRQKTGATIIGFKDAENGFIINPSPDLKISNGDVLIVLGKENEIQQCRKLLVK